MRYTVEPYFPPGCPITHYAIFDHEAHAMIDGYSRSFEAADAECARLNAEAPCAS